MEQDQGVTASSGGPGCQPSASAASRLRRVASLTRDYLGTLFRRSVPFLMCMVGGLCAMLSLQVGAGWVLAVVAGLFWAFALDMASEREGARVAKEWATKLFVMVAEDRYTEITVTNKQTYYADEATLAAVRALMARDSGSDPQGENSRSEVEGEASQSGAAKTAHRPNSPLNQDPQS